MNEITVKLDASAFKKTIADALDHGAILLPASAVQYIYDCYGVTEAELIEAGGVKAVSKE